MLNVATLINPSFDEVLFTDKSYVVLKGGRASTKSSVISLQLVLEFLDDPQANVLCLRKVGKYLSTSVYEQIKWAIYTLQVDKQFRFYSSPLKIVHKKTQTAFYFSGVDDPMKLKGFKIAQGYIHALWYEELAEFSGREDIDVVEDTFLRVDLPNGKPVKVYYSYNPPKNPYDWINLWVAEKETDPDYLVHHSTYLDDKYGFLGKQMIKKIDNYKVTDPDYYRWMYLGEVIGLGTHIYNMGHFKMLKELPTDDKLIGIVFGLDTGHQQSATACVACGITVKGKLILLDTLYYNPSGKENKLAPSQLSVLVHDFVDEIMFRYKGVPKLKMTIDSAEGALRNQYKLDCGEVWHPVAKKKKQTMIDHVLSLLAEGRFYYLETENNKIFYEEHKMYRYDEKTIESSEPKVIKEDDHSVDAFQYLVLDNARLLDLKV